MDSAPAEALARAFQLERFRDYLALEAGNSPHTVENYLRDVRRLVEYGSSRKIRTPGEVTAAQLREFIYFLKDLGLAATTIRRQISALRTYYKFLVGEGIVDVNRPQIVLYEAQPDGSVKLTGADYLVIGRQVTRAADPRAACERILDEISTTV